jgi:hypothetical protein
MGRAFQIAAQGIRIRLGRSLVTVSGVVLGIAFLMSNATSQLIRSALARERELRQTVNLMESLVRGEVGNLEGKTIGVVRAGALGAAEKTLLERLRNARPAEIRASGLEADGIPSMDVREVGRGVGLLLVLGNAPRSPWPLDELTAGMTEKVVLDSVASRFFPGGAPPSVRRELFFGKATDEQLAQARKSAERAQFRAVWIAVVSILVTIIGISNALLMSVTERFREIGTMKCLGALSGFIRRLFLLESAMVGLAGSLVGTVVGALIPWVAYGLLFGFPLMLEAVSFGELLGIAAASVAGGTIMAMLAAIYPANFAARMVPATALRTNV